MRTIALLLLLPSVPVLTAWSAGGDAPKGDLAGLQGTWKRTAAEVDGKKATEEELLKTTLTVKGDEYVLKMGDQTRKGHFKLDSTKTPKQIDIISGEGPNKGKSLPGIYELSGDTLRYCLSAPGKDRPTEFSSKPGSGHLLYVNKREKP